MSVTVPAHTPIYQKVRCNWRHLMLMPKVFIWRYIFLCLHLNFLRVAALFVKAATSASVYLFWNISDYTWAVHNLLYHCKGSHPCWGSQYGESL
jgi:hypothetical protein